MLQGQQKYGTTQQPCRTVLFARINTAWPAKSPTSPLRTHFLIFVGCLSVRQDLGYARIVNATGTQKIHHKHEVLRATSYLENTQARPRVLTIAPPHVPKIVPRRLKTCHEPSRQLDFLAHHIITVMSTIGNFLTWPKFWFLRACFDVSCVVMCYCPVRSVCLRRCVCPLLPHCLQGPPPLLQWRVPGTCRHD